MTDYEYDTIPSTTNIETGETDTALKQSAKQSKEMIDVYMKQGFSRAEAMQLLMTIMNKQ